MTNKAKLLFYVLFSVFLVLTSTVVFAQNNLNTTKQNSTAYKIYGRVTDEKNQGMEFASVDIFQDGILKVGTKTDINGKYSCGPLSVGNNYSIKVKYLGYLPLENKLISLTEDMQLDHKMTKKFVTIRCSWPVTLYKDLLVDPANPGQQIMRKSDMKRMPIH